MKYEVVIFLKSITQINLSSKNFFPGLKKIITLIIFSIIFSATSFSQDNYEIQVYGSQTQSPGSSMFELHSNYTFNGQMQTEKGVLPSYHSLHETLEITTGITPVFETGFYLFTSYVPGHGYQIVGSHIRPRIMAPQKWDLPVGLSLSVEFGYQRAEYSTDTWSIELRPIIDKQWKKLYISFNPTLGIALKSKYDNSVPSFEPNLKIGYLFFRNTSFGIEYYGDCGSINHFDKLAQQNHALFVVYDLQNNAKWELNIGGGFGLTQATDGFIFKVILGRRVSWKRK